MTGEARSETVQTRWLPAEITPVRELATAETEGNVSQMIRKLVREALTARAARTGAPTR